MSGVPISRSTMPNRRSTSSGSVGLQAEARALLSVQIAPSFSILRAASATLIFSRANSRASEALNPSPAPTMRAVLYFGVSMSVSLISLVKENLGAQTLQATCLLQNRIELALVESCGIFRAQ